MRTRGMLGAFGKEDVGFTHPTLPDCRACSGGVVRLGQLGPRQSRGRAERRARVLGPRVLGLGSLRLLMAQVMELNIRLCQSIGYLVDRTEAFMGGFTVYMSKQIQGE